MDTYLSSSISADILDDNAARLRTWWVEGTLIGHTSSSSGPFFRINGNGARRDTHSGRLPYYKAQLLMNVPLKWHLVPLLHFENLFQDAEPWDYSSAF